MLDKIPKDHRWIVTNQGYIEGKSVGPLCIVDHPVSSGGGPRWFGNGKTVEEAIEQALGNMDFYPWGQE